MALRTLRENITRYGTPLISVTLHHFADNIFFGATTCSERGPHAFVAFKCFERDLNFMFWTLSISGLLFPLIYALYGSVRNRLTGVVKVPSECLSESSSLVEVIRCLDDFTVDEDYYVDATYSGAQPTLSQREGWRTAITSLLAVDGNCALTLLPPELEGVYMIQPYKESTGASFCILLETQLTPDGKFFAKGWGTFITPQASTAVRRHLHLSAPHPKADLETPAQAAALFSASGAKSLLLAGRARTAYRSPTDCVKGHGTSGSYWKTDPAHNNLQPFYEANVQIWRWQQMNGGCASTSCAFVQLHGKGASTCPSDTVFLTTGLGGCAASEGWQWYNDSTDRPVKRLRAELAAGFPDWNIRLPSESDCILTATKNVVGRFLNGVPDSDVCEKNASVRDVVGYFIHAEQAIVSRHEAAYDGWIAALERAFVTVN